MESYAVGRCIRRATVSDPAMLDGVSTEEVAGALGGQVVTETHRHGKWLFVGVASGRWLVLHFGMTGGLAAHETGQALPRFTRLSLALDDGQSVTFVDPRKFGGATLTVDVEGFLRARRWGPDPTAPGFGLAEFRAVLAGRTGNLKGILLNQKVIAGIGNLYADEMLYQAGLHPETRAADLTPATVARLYDGMMRAFEASLAVGTRYEQLPESFLLHHRNRTCQCPRCGATLKIHRVAGRSTHYCPRHQRKRR